MCFMCQRRIVMKIIEQDVKKTEFAVWIDKEEKQLLEAFENMKKTLKSKDDRILLINPETFFGYDIESNTEIRLEIKRIGRRK